MNCYRKRFLDEKGQLLLERNQGSLEQVLKPFRERLDYFQQRINELHGQSLQGHSVISEQNQAVVECRPADW
ncbi:hypothetical protein OURE66S_02447 [Oligella ureolytica]